MKGDTVHGVGFWLGYHEWDYQTESSLPRGHIARGLVAQISDEGRGGRNIDLRHEASQIYDGDWHVATLCRQGGQVALFLDGTILVKKDASRVGSISTTADLIIGRHLRQKDYHIGKIQTIRFEPRAR